MGKPEEALWRERGISRGRRFLVWSAGMLAGLCLLGWLYLEALAAPVQPGAWNKIKVEIPAGATAAEIADILTAKGLVRHPWFFRLYVGWHNEDRDLKPGKYFLSPSMNINEIVAELKKGQPEFIQFTIPEGYTLKQIARLLAAKGLVTEEEFWRAASLDYPFYFLAGLPPGPQRLEGFLFPDTYRVTPGATAQEIISLLLKRFQEVYEEEIDNAQVDGLSTLEIVTLASIVEREAKKDGERPLIAGVFLNRLRRGMRLESCATVEYLLDEPKPVLSRADLEIPSPYNTYIVEGLPPGPIASPGRASLRAVLNPSPTDYLYFVAKPDGTHAFSRTLDEHNRAIMKYQKD
ncbi:MAG: hypothetical protein PWP65_785 [Clostridia bacterium]|nr:hypothetical protein [Clostridia bacterium]